MTEHQIIISRKGKKMPEIEDFTRLQIADFLPDAVDRAIKSYDEFPETASAEYSKDFKARHDARRMAIAHVKLLIDLAKWADLPEEMVAISQDKLADMIENASKEIEGHFKQE